MDKKEVLKSKEFKPWLDEKTPEERKELEKKYEIEKEFIEDLEKLNEAFVEKYAESFGIKRLTIPKEDDKGSFTEYTDFDL